MIIRILTTAFAVAAVSLAAVEADAQVTASSYSTGGTAISTASGRGNTRLDATAIATDGGYARADMRGSGRNGGFASGSSTAIAAGGVAISKGRSYANGWGARSNADSAAISLGGFARSNSTAIANGNWSNARSNAAAIATYGQYSNSRAKAVDNRWNQQPVYQTEQPAVYNSTGSEQDHVLQPIMATRRYSARIRNKSSQVKSLAAAFCTALALFDCNDGVTFLLGSDQCLGHGIRLLDGALRVNATTRV